MDVDKAVAFAEMSKEEFLALNPQHNRPVIAGADEFTLLLPIDKAELFASKLELENQPLVTWQAYRLQKNETFAQAANKFGMSLEALQAVNGLGRRAQAREGVTLLVPAQQPSWTAETSLTKAVFTTVPSGRVSYYKVKRGDTLAQIARRHGTTAEELMRLNGLKSAKNLRVGKNIRVYSDSVRTAAAYSAPPSARPSAEAANARTATATTVTTTAPATTTMPAATHYKVQKGDTLGKIASEYRVSVQDLMRWNALSSPKALRAGQNLLVTADASTNASASESEARLPAVRQPAARVQRVKKSPAQAKAGGNESSYYQVQKGDTLFNIAPRYGVSVDDLMRWNDLKKVTALRAGQTIRISGKS
jgi:membrane-bound lytic murein transglycosylase D